MRAYGLGVLRRQIDREVVGRVATASPLGLGGLPLALRLTGVLGVAHGTTIDL